MYMFIFKNNLFMFSVVFICSNFSLNFYYCLLFHCCYNVLYNLFHTWILKKTVVYSDWLRTDQWKDFFKKLTYWLKVLWKFRGIKSSWHYMIIVTLYILLYWSRYANIYILGLSLNMAILMYHRYSSFETISIHTFRYRYKPKIFLFL
jgi:hypothetical protein